MNLTEKIKEASKNVTFLMKAKREYNLTDSQIQTLMYLVDREREDVRFEWRSLPVLKKYNLIDEDLNPIFK